MSMSEAKRVVFQPAASRGLQRGINQMVDAVRPTLGPLPRLVAMARVMGDHKAPEMLDNGGIIARRIIELGDRDADMGAMFVRSVLWRQHESEGDGTVTAAVLFQSIFNQGLHYITSGGDAMQLRRYLERALPAVLTHIEQQAMPVEGQAALSNVATSICGDRPLGNLLGEIFDIVGEFGNVDIRSSQGRDLEREYVEGSYWSSEPLARWMVLDKPHMRGELENPAVLISDLEINGPEDVVPLLQAAMDTGAKGLYIVALTISESALGVLWANNKPGAFEILAAKAPGYGDAMRGTLEDLGYLTGGRAFHRGAGDQISSVRPEHLGRARRAWVDKDYMGLNGAQGNPTELREHIAQLRRMYAAAKEQEARKLLRERIGRLMGGAATLYVGGATETEAEHRKEVAERTASALRGAIMEGTVPGGGVALLGCREPLRALLAEAGDADERAAYRILLRALEEPIRALAANAGFEPADVMADLRGCGPCHGFDVLSGKVVDVLEAGIIDSTSVVKAAVRRAVTSAALALTTDVLVHHQTPEQALNP